ncbi:MAG: hypothetical protein JWP22_3869 [Ramlibacter sp.]|nr:hypothetical protein [Ramlibacter sp.]MDB5915194.1 hypothetical protein [Ramlibacter sp.]
MERIRAFVLSGLLRAAVAAVVLSMPVLPPVQAGQFTANVTVSVKLASSSGVCGVRTNSPAVGVSCGTGAHRLIAAPGTSYFQRVGAIPAFGVAVEPLPVYSDGAKITSWRIVQLDNKDYVELTVAW